MSRPVPQIVDTTESIKRMLDDLLELPKSPPSLYVDLEGVSLSRHGSISILQLYVQPKSAVYLVDIHILGPSAFDTEWSGSTLRSVLECESTPKVFFDCRNDSDALYAHFGIALQNVVDVQLLEVATRGKWVSKNRLKGLGTLIQRDCVLSEEQMRDSHRIKDQGRALFAPECGGSYNVFNERPFRAAIVEYCAQDVTCLPELWAKYEEAITAWWANEVEVQTVKRIEQSQSEGYRPNGPWKSWSPWINPYDE